MITNVVHYTRPGCCLDGIQPFSKFINFVMNSLACSHFIKWYTIREEIDLKQIQIHSKYVSIKVYNIINRNHYIPFSRTFVVHKLAKMIQMYQNINTQITGEKNPINTVLDLIDELFYKK